MVTELLDPRRAPRVPVRLLVDVQDRTASFRAMTEDLGPRGCQVVAPRGVPVGSEVQLAFHGRGAGRPLRTSARVVWCRTERPCRLGVAFVPGPVATEALEELAGVEAAPRSLRRPALRLPGDAALFLGEPPAAIVDLSHEELVVLRRVGSGTRVQALARDLGAAFERVRGAVFGLLARRLLTLDPRAATAPERWSDALAKAEGDLARPGGAKSPAASAGTERPAAAQRLYDEGVAHLAAGRMAMALARFREALSAAPADRAISGAVQRLAPWVR